MKLFQSIRSWVNAEDVEAGDTGFNVLIMFFRMFLSAMIFGVLIYI